MGSVSGGGVVQLPGEARTIDVGGFTVVVHAGAGVTSGAFSLIEPVEAIAGWCPPNRVNSSRAIPWHTHYSMDRLISKGT